MELPEAAAGCQSTPCPVPAFLGKLWALLEDPGNSALIRWSWNGQAFCIVDEQRFAKELLPKYFKHNNLSSFIRQLNMYGFRKVISLESSLFRSDKDSAMEFQHPLFKQGHADLLGHIKRKASAVRAEEGKPSHDDLHKVLLEVQEMRDEQNNMDAQLDLMRRENQALWKEVSVLRRKHNQQQKLLTKILQFILSLMRRNYVVGVKRKRPLMDASGSTSPKYSRHYMHIPVENGAALDLEHKESGREDDEDGVVIQEITDSAHRPTQRLHSPAKATEACGSHQQVLSSPGHSASLSNMSQPSVVEQASAIYLHEINGNSLESGGKGDLLELPSMIASDVEDPDTVFNSILNESSSASHNDILLDREEMQDFLNCIDVSLEELQVLLSRTKYSLDSERVKDLNNSDISSLDTNLTEAAESKDSTLTESIGKIQPSECKIAQNKDKQLMQYMGNTILSLFDDLPSNEVGRTTEDSEDLLRELQENATHPLTFNSNDTLLQSASPSLNEQVNLLETYELPLLVEDVHGDYQEPPLFVLSPVNNLIEEATEAEVG